MIAHARLFEGAALLPGAILLGSGAMGAGAVRVAADAVDCSPLLVVAEPIDGEVRSLRPEAAALLLLLRSLPQTARV
eukprot:591255-Rhodomonas_salina.1